MPESTVNRLRIAMSILGLSEAEEFSEKDAQKLLNSLGVDAEAQHVSLFKEKVEAMERLTRAREFENVPLGVPIAAGSKGRQGFKITKESLMAGLSRAHALRTEPGRYYALLSLAEAEAVRVALHQARLILAR